MAVTIDIDTSKSITLQECIESIKSLTDLGEGESLQSAALYLKQLSNNNDFLIDLINLEIESLDDLNRFQEKNGFSQQIIDLGGTSEFWLRANIWPPSKNKTPADWEKGLFAYDMPHDHTSDFLTVGYWGPGYETDIYEYDPSTLIGYEGEKVDIKFIERTRLHKGKVMYYRANRDIHTQIIPSEFSISINLLLVSQEKGFGRNQYWFDLDEQTIKSTISRSGLTSFVFLCGLAQYLGDKDSLLDLKEIALNHANPHIRVEALESLLKLDKERVNEYVEIALGDDSPYVKHWAHQQNKSIAELV